MGGEEEGWEIIERGPSIEGGLLIIWINGGGVEVGIGWIDFVAFLGIVLFVHSFFQSNISPFCLSLVSLSCTARFFVQNTTPHYTRLPYFFFSCFSVCLSLFCSLFILLMDGWMDG